MKSNLHFSPLRYPGGKASFTPFVTHLMEVNNLLGGDYLEPYAGGAGVALALLFQGKVKHIHINDLDPAIHALWVAIKEHPKKMLKLLNTTPITMDEWEKWREILRDEKESNLVKKGFATLFMNRTNHSGVLKGGVIGGKEQKGVYKIDARFNKVAIAQKIINISQYAKYISVYCEDALALLQRCENILPKRSLIYLDPPYYIKGKGLYRNYYAHQDHCKIARELQNKKFPRSWIVSYDNVIEIEEMYQLSQSFRYQLNYSAQRKYIGNEIMFFNQKLKIPENFIPQLKQAV